MAAAHQASSSSDLAANYEVFLSFHGNDVRNNFADHLYNALVTAGIRTFRDSEELHKGNKIEKELLTAIQESSISIPIFSENYPSSKWCLNELTQISKCIGIQIVMPIFYKVEPRDVRNQTGIHEKAFEQHQINMASAYDVQKWKEAMKKVGELKGWHVDEKTSEVKVIEEIVRKVYAELKKKPMSEDGNLVGDIQIHKLGG